MKQFKRLEPEKLTHIPECSLPETLTDGISAMSQVKSGLWNASTQNLPVIQQDGALSLALQQEFKEQEVPRSLEEAGLFFCQICQKDLSAMNSVRREQHANRCLDDMESLQVPSASTTRIPECPICGKLFHAPKSRANHLKRCANKMEVPPQLLLQAVRLQASALSDGPLAAPSQLSTSKRKGCSKEKESTKKRKTVKMGGTDEDLMVAMAMSRSLLEEEEKEKAKSVPSIILESTAPNRRKPRADICEARSRDIA
uniref:UBZ4-type domain-containing protein n=1 Tax=Sphenodon punctatus TaxID=8508 RepID=A0A8D0HHC0_SPHPU